MENRYLIIASGGEVYDPEQFAKSKECSKEFAEFVKLEMKEDGSDKKDNEPQYLQIAKKFGFHWEPNGDIGHILYDHKAWSMMLQLQKYARKLVNSIGFPVEEIRGANMFNMSHPVVESYAQLYGDRLYNFKSGKNEVVMSYDASYPQFNLAAMKQLSYKDLPFAHFSISDCYRHEQHGECSLLYRMRRFFMPDLHPYFKDLREAFEWYPKIEAQLLRSGKEVGRDYMISAKVSGEENWLKHKEEIVKLAKSANRPIVVGIDQSGKDMYWIINVDYKIIDQLGQSREICCIQIDVGNASRLGIEYVDKDGKKKHPVIIHSAVPGGLERYIYMVLDGFPSSMPDWLYPVFIRLVPVSEKFNKFASRIKGQLEENDIPVDMDLRDISVGARIKAAKEDLVPHVIVLGEDEKNGLGNSELLERLADQYRESVREIEK